MDKLDLKILNELDNNPRITTSNLAKKIKISQQVADYRIKRLIKDDVIYSIATVVNPFVLGFNAFNVMLTFEDFPEERQKELMDYMQNNNKVFWAGITGGKYDVVIVMIVKDYNELDQELSNLFKLFSNCFRDYEILPIVKMHQYKYAHISKNQIYEFNALKRYSKIPKLDNTDYKILDMIKDNARLSYLEIARRVGVSYPTVKKRINDMKKENVVVGYKIFVRPSKLGLKSYKLILSVKNYSKQREDKLFSYANAHKNIVYAYKLVGGIWTFNLDVEIESAEKLQVLINRLRREFPLIDDFRILQVFKNLIIDHFPASKEYVK